MSDETSNRIPEFDAMARLQQGLAQKKAESSFTRPTSRQATVDPYQMMLKRREANADEALTPVQSWPEADIKKLEEFCLKHGIVGFNTGRLSPLVALALLKQKLGVHEDSSQTEGRNSSYSDSLKKRILLRG